MEISTGYNTQIVAVARSTSYERIEGRLSIYELEADSPVREFPGRYDIGGRRLSVSRDSQRCFVGCFNLHGLAAYSALDGSELWRRRDLKAVQYVHDFPFDDVVFCGREGAGHLLCAKTGATIEKIGVKKVYPSPFSRIVMVGARSLDVHSPFGTRIGSIKRTTFAELDCCFSDSEILVTESGGAVRCFDLSSFKLLWTHTPNHGSHFLRLCFSQTLGCFVGVCYNYQDSSQPRKCVVHFDRRTGRAYRELPINNPAAHDFCLAGSAIFTSDLRMISLEAGDLIREFRLGTEDDDNAA